MAMSSTPLFRKEITNINQEHFGQLIGKLGSRLSEIQIEFEQEEKESGLKMRLNSIKSKIVLTANDSKTLDKCEQIFQLLIEEIETKGQLSKYSVPRSFRKLNDLSKFPDVKKPTYNETTQLYSYSLQVKKKYIGRLIGRGGATKNWIENQYEFVRIEFESEDRDDVGDTLKHVVITSNNSDDCQSAFIRLKEVYEEISSNNSTEHRARAHRIRKRLA